LRCCRHRRSPGQWRSFMWRRPTGELPVPLPHRRAPCAAADFRASIELRNGEPPFLQAMWHCAESTYCKRMFQVFQIFHLSVACVSSGYCKSRLNVAHVAMTIHVCYKCMFQMFRLFLETYVACVFIWTLHMLHMCAMTFHVFLGVSAKYFRCLFQVFHLSIDICRKCFIWMF
jgi:hypothetical protein